MCDLVPWDAIQSIRLLHNISRLVQSEKNANITLKNLENLAKRFYERALEQQYQPSLTNDQHLELEREYSSLADWCQSETQTNKLEKIRLQICLLEIVRFVITKAGHSLRDAFWARNAVKLALETAIDCHQANQFLEMDWCLNEANFYCQIHIQAQSNLQHELKASYAIDGSLLSVLRLLWIYGSSMKRDESLLTSHLKTFIPIELSFHHSSVVAKIYFNIGLEKFNNAEFESAIFFLKRSYYFVGLGGSGKRGNRINKTLRLVALCLIKINALENRDLILHILDCAEKISDVPTVADLKFRTLLSGKSQLFYLTQNAYKLFKFYLSQGIPNFRKNVLLVFRKLERSGNFEAIKELLDRIPWRATENNSISNPSIRDLMPHIQWICAEVAICTCIKQDFQSGAYLWLEEIVRWVPSKDVNLESLNRILNVGQAVAVQLQSRHLAFKWFRTLVKLTHRFGGQTSVIFNALRYSLAANSLEGFIAAKELFDEELSKFESSVQLHRFKLLVDVLHGNLANATATWLQLEGCYKKETDLDSDPWQEAMYILEMGTMIALKRRRMDEIAVHCLSAMVIEIKRRSLQTSLLVHFIRFHLKVLFKWAVGNILVETKCIDSLIAALIFAFLGLKENLSSGARDSGGLELWFGHLSWSLGHKLHASTAFNRHQLFKLSHKLLSLTEDKDEDLNEKIITSLILSIAAAINSRTRNKIRYRQVLNNCLEMISINRDVITSSCLQKTTQLYLYEFYILCELGDINRLRREFQRYQSHKFLMRNPSFFEGLAALSLNENRYFLRQILPPVESRQLPLDNDELSQREPLIQAKLSEVAIDCLRISNCILVDEAQPLAVHQINLNWKRIITLLSRTASLHQSAAKSHLTCCKEYLSFITEHRGQLNFEEVSLFFNYVWNMTTELAVYKNKNESEEWVQLIRKVACLTPELQKLYRSLLKDLQTKFCGAWS